MAVKIYIFLLFLNNFSYDVIAASISESEKKRALEAEIETLLKDNSPEAKKQLNEIRNGNGYKNPERPNENDIAYLLLIKEAKAARLWSLYEQFAESYPRQAAICLHRAAARSHEKAKTAIATYQSQTPAKKQTNLRALREQLSIEEAKEKSKITGTQKMSCVSLTNINRNTKNADEQFQLGYHHYKLVGKFIRGSTSDINNQRNMIKYLKLAAEQDHEGAIDKLIDAYVSMTAEHAKALELAQEKANKGQRVGKFKLGELLFHGRGVPKDEALAKLYIKEAADLGYAKAIVHAKTLEIGGDDNKVAEMLGPMLTLLGLGESKEPIKEVFLRAAKRGEPSAQHSLGIYFTTGTHGFEKDPKEAKKWLTLAAGQKHPPAQLELAFHYYNEHKSTGSKSAANNAFKLLYELHINPNKEGKLKREELASSRALLCDCYENGIGVDKNPTKANEIRHLALLQKDAGLVYIAPLNSKEALHANLAAAEKGDDEAMVRLGLRYLLDFEGEQNYAKAISYMKDAEGHGSGTAKIWLMMLSILEKGETREGTDFASFDQGHPAVHTFYVALCYLRGIGIEKDIKRGNLLLDQILQLDDKPGHRKIEKFFIKFIRKLPFEMYFYETEKLYNIGKEFETSRPKQFLGAIILGASLGHRECQYELGKYFQNSNKAGFKDTHSFWFRIAALFGHLGAREALRLEIEKAKLLSENCQAPIPKKKKDNNKNNDIQRLYFPASDQAPIAISAYNPIESLERRSAEEEFAELLQAANNKDNVAGIKVGCFYYKQKDFNRAKEYFYRSLTDSTLDPHAKSVALNRMRKIDPDFVFNPETIHSLSESNSFYLKKFCHQGKNLLDLYSVEVPILLEETLLATPQITVTKDNLIKFEKTPLYEKNIEALNLSAFDEERLFNKLREQPRSNKILKGMKHRVMKTNFHIENYNVGRIAYAYEESFNRIILLGALEKKMAADFSSKIRQAFDEYLENRFNK